MDTPPDPTPGKGTSVPSSGPLHVEIELSEAAVKRKAFSDAMQLPEALVPLAACVMSAGYLLLLGPIVGAPGSPPASTVVSGAITVVVASVRYPREHMKNAQQLTERMEQHRRLLEKAELDQLRDTIKSGFSAISSHDGIRTVDALVREYAHLVDSVSQRRATDPLSISVIPALAQRPTGGRSACWPTPSS